MKEKCVAIFVLADLTSKNVRHSDRLNFTFKGLIPLHMVIGGEKWGQASPAQTLALVAVALGALDHPRGHLGSEPSTGRSSSRLTLPQCDTADSKQQGGNAQAVTT